MKDVLQISEQKDILTARLSAEIDHHSCRSMREEIDLALFDRGPRTLVLDFSEVCFMDSSGLGLILGRAEKADSIGAVVEVRGLSESLMRLVRLSGIERIKNLKIK
jgi:stage II sporulation protein AA (anti-sigma F factor antagonist)